MNQEKQTLTALCSLQWTLFLPRLKDLIGDAIDAGYLMDWTEQDKVALSCGMIPIHHYRTFETWAIEQIRSQQQAHYDKLGYEADIQLHPDFIKEAHKQFGAFYHSLIYDIHRKYGGHVIQ